MRNDHIRNIQIVTVVWHGECVDVPVTFFNPGHAMPVAYTPDCPGYDDEGDPGEVEFDTPMIAGVSKEFMAWLCLEDDENFVSLVFEEMSNG